MKMKKEKANVVSNKKKTKKKTKTKVYNYSSNSTLSLSLSIWEYDSRSIKILDVPLSDTIIEIKERVCDELIKQIGQTYANEPEDFRMVFNRSLVMDDDTSKTLGEVLIGVNLEKYLDNESVPKGSTCLIIQLFPIGTKLPHEFHKDSDDEEVEVELGYIHFIDDGECGTSNSDEEVEFLDPEDAFTLKRPDDGILPTDMGTLRVYGELLAYRHGADKREKMRYIPYKGPTYPLEMITKLSTATSLVLLAFNSANREVVEDFQSMCEFSLSSPNYTSLANILVLQVSWDKQSYLFLRMLRKHLNSEVPIVAVTDLDVRHLDLLVFLDTRPCDVPKHYGWDLSEECARLGVKDTECVDIKWLGMRPSDAVAPSPYLTCFANATCKLPEDFREVCDFLLAHPNVAANTKRVEEVKLVSAKKMHRSLPFMAGGAYWRGPWSDTRFGTEDYLFDKLMKHDWI